MTNRNVTVALDEDLARWVRVDAAERDVSVSQFLADVLAERRRRSEGYEMDRQLYLSREPRPLRRTGDHLPGRSEVHDRTPERSNS